MKKIIYLFFFIAEFIFAQSKEEKINSIVNTYYTINHFSGSVLVAEKGKIIYEKSYGYKNASLKEKNTNNSIYRIYSTTKTFTAISILQLEEQGKLSLKDPISKYFNGYPNGNRITIENLLTHTSGIPDEGDPENTKDENSFIQFISTKQLDFIPGSKYNYSNSNYYFLGFIIYKVSGRPYDEYILENILKPLQMNSSYFNYEKLTNLNKAKGYEFLVKDKFVEAPIYKYNHPQAAGALCSTIHDLFLYYEGLKNYTILKKETLDKAITPFNDNHYGYGWEIDTLFNKTIVGHSGGGDGFHSRFLRVLDDDICVIVLGNSDNSDVFPISYKIIQVMLDKPFDLPSTKTIDKKELKNLEGVYSNPEVNIYVKNNNGLLQFYDNQGGFANLLYEKPYTYYTNNADGSKVRNVFEKDKTGKIISTKIYFPNGKILDAKKISSYINWGIVGSATPNNWNGPDIKLVQKDKKKKLLIAENIQLKKGEFKFRVNNEWVFDLGIKENNNLIKYGENCKVEDGIYTIILDFTDEMHPKYNLKKIK